MEADSEKRAVYLKTIATIDPKTIVYIDESGIDTTDVKDRGWGKKNEPLVGKKSGNCHKRINIVAGYVNGQCIAPMTFKSSCDSVLFSSWVKQCLCKTLTPGQTIILDNASFHTSSEIVKLANDFHCTVIFLPPYSPDLNPIEKFWARMKLWLRNHLSSFDSFSDALFSFFNPPISI